MRLKFQIIQLILALMTFFEIQIVNAIKCYECSVTKNVRQNEVVDKLCTKFKGSEDDFEKDCPYSTMCEKRVLRIHLLNEVQEAFERGCAKQKNTSMVYSYKKRKWEDEVSVEEAYTEGCFKNSEDDNEYCYCRGNYCNESPKLKIELIALITCLTIVSLT